MGTKQEGRRREKASFSMPGGGEGLSEGSSSLRASGSWNRGAFHAAGCGKTSVSGAQSSPCSRNDVALGCWYRGHIPGAQTGIKPPREWLIPPGIAPEPRAGEGIRGKGCSQRCCKFNCVLKNNQLWAWGGCAGLAERRAQLAGAALGTHAAREGSPEPFLGMLGVTLSSPSLTPPRRPLRAIFGQN